MIDELKTIEVEFFAAYREAAGVAEVTVTTSAPTAEALFDELRAQYPKLEAYPSRKLAINDELSAWGDAIKDGDRVLLFPPVAGG